MAFKNKRKVILILLLIIIIPIIYIVINVNKNVREMANSYSIAYNYPEYPSSDTKEKNASEIKAINHGEYLVKAGDCIACHTNTPANGPAFAGGLPMQTAFGTIYTPNITADKETGIGNWTDAQFIEAMHEGISPQGNYYYPAFPYLYFNKITNEDLSDIKAYLNSIPVVHQENRKNDMVWPFNWRFLQLGWRVLFFRAEDTGPYKTDAERAPAWNRGAYLVEGLGHCAMCHTPSYYLLSDKLSLGAPIRKYNLTGAIVQGYLAPNITKTNLGGISNEKLIGVFTNARLLGGGELQGPMLEAVHDSLSKLTTPDLLAIATYLKTVESAMPSEPTPGKSGIGESIYNNYCSGCHASGLDGAPKLGDAASWGPLVRSGMKKLYTVAINGAGNMPPKGMCRNCLNSDIRHAVDYMVSTTMNGSDQQVVIAKQSSKLTITDGERIYQAHCSSCHDTGVNNAPKMGDQKAWQPIVEEGFLNAYQNVVTGKNGHPAHGGCVQCNDEEILAAMKYIMQKSTTGKNYILW